MKHAHFESERGDGLYAVATRAAKAVAGPGNDPVGLVEVTREGDENESLSVEAVFAYRGLHRTIEALHVRLRRYGEELALGEEALHEAFEHFGGLRYTNVCAVGPPEGREIDVTVTFPSRVPFWAKNLVLLPEGTTSTEADVFGKVLDSLGVSWVARGGGISARTTQLRGRMTAAQQARAYRAALDGGLDVSVYAAPLPAIRSVRLSQGTVERNGGTTRCVDCFLSRGLTGAEVLTTSDASEMEGFFQRHLGSTFAGRRWSVENIVAEGPPVEWDSRPQPRRPSIKFSFWIKG